MKVEQQELFRKVKLFFVIFLVVTNIFLLLVLLFSLLEPQKNKLQMLLSMIFIPWIEKNWKTKN